VRVLCLLGLLLFATNSFAEDWTTADTLREVAWQVVNAADWGTTLEIARHPNEYKEYNPLLGHHPSVGKVNTYFIAGAVAHFGVSYLLPKEWRPWWQYASIGISGACAVHNLNVGLRIKFWR
jgi:hypothetical protein